MEMSRGLSERIMCHLIKILFYGACDKIFKTTCPFFLTKLLLVIKTFQTSLLLHTYT